jgi:hypothetical protein
MIYSCARRRVPGEEVVTGPWWRSLGLGGSHLLAAPVFTGHDLFDVAEVPTGEPVHSSAPSCRPINSRALTLPRTKPLDTRHGMRAERYRGSSSRRCCVHTVPSNQRSFPTM